MSPADFDWHIAPVPEPGPGEVLLRTHYLGLAPVMRMYMRGAAGSTGEAPLGIGDVIHGRGVAQIVKSRHPDWREGEVVQGELGWQTWKVSAMTPGERMIRCPDRGLPALLDCKLLGMTGLSAHAGLFACGEPRAGDRMVLSGAADGVGSIVSQLANVAGADVVGIAGGPEKRAAILDLGCRAAIDYKHEDLRARLAALRPEGIDLYFDNVGGDTLDAVLDRLALRARIVLCGSISEYGLETPFALPGYTRLRGRDARMQGFFVYNHLDRWDAVMDELADHVRFGRLRPVHAVEQGFEHMPRALARLYAGENIGTVLCDVRGEPEGRSWQG